MARHTSFRFRLDPSVEQERVLSRHVGAARFAFNQALRLHKDARAQAGDRQAAGLVTNAHRQNTPTYHDPHGRNGKGLDDVGTNPQTAPAA